MLEESDHEGFAIGYPLGPNTLTFYSSVTQQRAPDDSGVFALDSDALDDD
jgi:hypothetical protein